MTGSAMLTVAEASALVQMAVPDKNGHDLLADLRRKDAPGRASGHYIPRFEKIGARVFYAPAEIVRLVIVLLKRP